MILFNDMNNLTYILALGFLGLWFLFAGSRKWNVVMGIGFFLTLMANFLFTMGLTLGPVKYFIFSKNLILIGFFGFIFMLVRKNKIALVLAIVTSLFLSLQLFKMKLDVDLLPPKVRENLELGELLIEASPDKLADIEQTIARYGGLLARAFHPLRKGTDLDDFYLIDIPDERSDKKEELLTLLQREKLILHGEYNDRIQLQPLEGLLNKSPRPAIAINDPLVEEQWALPALKMDEWYRLLIDHRKDAISTAVVAVLDTGIDGGHEDLTRMMDKNGRQGDDPVGHGTHCAGIIAAETNNKTGVASMAFHNDLIRLMPVKVLNRLGFGTQAQIIRGMIKAVDDGADVLSMSLGGISDTPRQKAYQAAVQYAENANAVVVTSAGNSSASARGFTPANVPGVICVTALNENNRLAGFSNYLDGIERGIAAPGVSIMSTYPGNQYKSLSGTSMAAPFVSSTIAVMKAFAPELSSQELYDIILRTSIATTDDPKSGSLIQPAKALQAVLDRVR